MCQFDDVINCTEAVGRIRATPCDPIIDQALEASCKCELNHLNLYRLRPFLLTEIDLY